MPTFVSFCSKRLQLDFEKLKYGRYEERQLFLNIEKFIANVKENAFPGIKIQKRIWPFVYIK
jgi:hypothetical protein